MSYHYSGRYGVRPDSIHKVLTMCPDLYLQGRVFSDEHGMSFEELVKTIIDSEKSSILNTLEFNLLSYYDQLKKAYITCEFRESNVLNLLTTPAALGGIGISFDNSGFNHKSRRMLRIKEEIVKPRVAYPPSQILRETNQWGSSYLGYESAFEQLLESVHSTNKVLKPIGTISVLPVKNITSLSRQHVSHLTIDEILSIMSGTDKDIFSNFIKPILLSEIGFSSPKTELCMSYLRGAHREALMDEGILTKMFVNVEEILRMSRCLSVNVYRDWLLGRLDIRKCIRFDLSNTIISLVYKVYLANMFRCAYSGTITLTYDSIYRHCLYIESVLLPQLVNRMRSEKIEMRM
jgi:hypothetical protein